MNDDPDYLFDDLNGGDRIAAMRGAYSIIDKGVNQKLDVKDARARGLEEIAISTGMDEEPEWIYDIVNDEFYLDDQAIRILYASLCVVITSGTENFFETICQHYSIRLRRRATWGDKRKALEERLAISFEDLPGFEANKRARLMANCFKHSGGLVDIELAQFSELREGAEIEYEVEPWERIISETEKMLRGICDAMARTA
jgi:hypothetical protein